MAEEEPENEVAPLCSITLEGEKVTLLEIRGGFPLVIQVTANKEWTLSSNGSWCTPSHQSGMATTTELLEVTLQLEANETDAVRSVQLIPGLIRHRLCWKSGRRFMLMRLNGRPPL